MNRFISILFIVMMMLPAFINVAIITAFQINRTAIAQEFCENLETDKNCQGTCHLIKKIEKQNTEEHNSPFTTIKNLKSELLFLEPEEINLLVHASNLTQEITYLLKGMDSHINNVFHPPKLNHFRNNV